MLPPAQAMSQSWVGTGVFELTPNLGFNAPSCAMSKSSCTATELSRGADL